MSESGYYTGRSPAGHSCKHQVPGGDLVGVTRQVVNRPLTDRIRRSVVCPATSTAASGPVMSCCSPNNVIVVNREQSPFAARYESLPIGPGYRPVATPRLRSGVTLRDLIEREGEGS